MRWPALLHPVAARPTAACIAALLALAPLGAAGCGRYGPPTREAPRREPAPAAEANRPGPTNERRLEEGSDADRSEQASTADKSDVDDATKQQTKQ